MKNQNLKKNFKKMKFLAPRRIHCNVNAHPPATVQWLHGPDDAAKAPVVLANSTVISILELKSKLNQQVQSKIIE